MNKNSKESNLMGKLSKTPALHLHDICLITKPKSFPAKTVAHHMIIEECENKESRSESVDEYRIPPFAANDLPRQSEEGRDPSASPAIRKHHIRKRRLQHVRNTCVFDGSTEDMHIMLSGMKRQHRRSHNRAFVSQQFNEIFEDVFMAPANADPNRRMPEY
jgi:hypothetical protein